MHGAGAVAEGYSVIHRQIRGREAPQAFYGIASVLSRKSFQTVIFPGE